MRPKVISAIAWTLQSIALPVRLKPCRGLAIKLAYPVEAKFQYKITNHRLIPKIAYRAAIVWRAIIHIIEFNGVSALREANVVPLVCL